MNQTLVTEERVIQELRKHIAETLRIDESAVISEKSLIKDLGAESLDFLDINYRLEQTFGIRTARHFVLEHIEEMFGEGFAIDENSRLTEKGVQLLKLRLGDQHGELKPGMELQEVSSLITVQSLVNGILDILNTLPETCPSCSRNGWETGDGVRVRCGACGQPAVFASGDDLIKEWLRKTQEEKKVF